jgi:hypothetical protein
MAGRRRPRDSRAMDGPSGEPDRGETRRAPALAGKSWGAFSLGTFFVADKESTLNKSKRGSLLLTYK